MLYQFFFLIFHLSLIQGLYFRSLQGKSSPKSKPSPSPYSIPSEDNDINSRNIRRNIRTKNWSTRKYSEHDKYYNFTDLVNIARKQNFPDILFADDFPFVAPTGYLGASQVAQETISMATEQLGLRSQEWSADIPAVYATVLGQGGFPTFDSFLTAYNALPADKRPTSASFYDSDAAFADRYITASPLYIKKVTASSQIPFDTSSINGLADIIAPNTLSNLISSGKLFIVDFTAYGIASGDQSTGSIAEAPIGLFFVSKSGRLMPLAIKFTIQNTITYSPKDSHADWFLAKAVFNMVDTTILSLVHFVEVHFVLSHICQSLQQSFASEHPFYALISISCSKNEGLLQNGLPSLLPDGGAYDSILALSGNAIRTKFLKNIGNSYDWSKKGLDFDLNNRGVRNIPNFDYANDATKLYQIISTFASSFLSSYYRSDSKIQTDTELTTFISKLSSSTSPLKINGFPSTVTTVSSLVEITTRIVFLTGVQHHALNSNNVKNYYLAYPHSPGKIPGVPPAKNLINDDYLKNNILMLGLPIASFLPLFLGSIQLDYLFIPVLGATSRLDSASFIPTSDGKVDAFVQMRDSLNDLSDSIQDRATKETNEGIVPPYITLDPSNLPFGTAI